jgi:TolB-like protein/Flp pilus assembly protein TadD
LSFFEELKRRNVFRVAIAYLAFAWLLIEVAGTLFPGFGIPDWAFRFVVILLALGFVPTLVLSWAYEITPDGLKREKEVVRDAASAKVTAKRLDWITILLVVAAFAFIAVDRVWLQVRPAAQTASPAAETDRPPDSEAADTTPNSIAVLPFANRSANPDDVFFVDGIHDDLLTFISQIGTLKTISRTSVMQYRDSTKPIPQIAAELGVGTVLEGGVQRAGNQVRINVQLIDAATDAHLWSKIYDRELTAANIFAIQSEIAGEIADALRETLTPQARRRIDTVPTENLAALEAYFVGKQSMALRTGKALDLAIEKFEEAISLDPAFALAWVNLADAARLATSYGGTRTRDEALQISRAAVDRALELDPTLGEAHVALANLRRWEDRYDAAEAAYQRGIELNPNYASAYQWYGEMLGLDLSGPGMAGRMAEALELSKKAVELDPLSPIINNDYGEVLEQAGRPEEALVYFRKAVDIEPRFITGYLQIASLYSESLSRVDEAVLALREAIDRDSTSWFRMSWLGWLYLNLGDSDKAADWHQRALDSAPDGVIPDIAIEWAIERGEYELALELARSASENDWQSDWQNEMLAHLLLKSGRTDEARVSYADAYPGLFDEENPQIQGDWRPVPTAVLILSRSGDRPAAERLANTTLELLSNYPRTGPGGKNIADARLLAILGNREGALVALRQAVDEGWRDNWWYLLEHDPALEALHDEPLFITIRKKIEADMARQRARLRERLNAEGT